MQRVAAQSIIYGNFVDDWQRAFQEISHAGFSGIELFQSPSNLVTLESELGFASAQKPKPTIESILQTLQNLNLTMLGLTGGPIEERIEFSGHFNHQEKLPYIYIEDWNTEIENLYNIHTETVFALHPHISRPVETYEEAIKLLGEKRRVKFLPDTAHIGIRSKQILPLLREYNHRIAAVHLKDWDHRYGKSRITYARGFTELGKGSLNLEELRDWLTSVYTGWIVIEQDFTTSRPIDSLKRSLSWLNKEKSGTVYSLPIFSRQTQKSPGSIPDLLDGCSRGLNDFYSSLSDFTAAHFACKTIDIWEINNRERVADYVASYPTRSEVFQPVGKNLIEVDFYDCLSHRRPKISRQEPGGARVLYLPIANYFNPNDVLLVLIATLSENFEYIEWSSFLYYHKLISHIYVKFWIARISEIRETFLFFYDNSLDISDYLEKSAIHIRTLLGCDEVSIYLESSDHAHLQCRGKSRSGGKIGGEPPSLSLESDNSIVSKVFRTRSEVSLRIGHNRPNFRHQVTTSIQTSSRLVSPVNFFDGEPKCIAVIECRKKTLNLPDSQFDFSLSDEIFLNSICVSVASDLNTFIKREQKDIAARCMRHETRNPVTYAKGALSRLARELGTSLSTPSQRVHYLQKDGRIASILRSDTKKIIDEIEGYLDHIKVVVGRSYALQDLSPNDLFVQRIVIADELLTRSFEDLSGLISRKKDSFGVDFSYTIDGIRGFPAIYGDKVLLRSVVLNLIINSIKYCDVSKGLISISIDVREYNGIEICFKDNGLGVTPTNRERIFEMGFRDPKSRDKGGSGDGLGLWHARRVCSLHNGKIFVRTCSDPTEFVISFPSGIKNPNWHENSSYRR